MAFVLLIMCIWSKYVQYLCLRFRENERYLISLYLHYARTMPDQIFTFLCYIVAKVGSS